MLLSLRAWSIIIPKDGAIGMPSMGGGGGAGGITGGSVGGASVLSAAAESVASPACVWLSDVTPSLSPTA